MPSATIGRPDSATGIVNFPTGGKKFHYYPQKFHHRGCSKFQHRGTKKPPLWIIRGRLWNRLASCAALCAPFEGWG